MVVKGILDLGLLIICMVKVDYRVADPDPHVFALPGSGSA